MIVVVQITKKSRFIRRHSQKRFIFYGLGYKLYPKKEPRELNRIEMNSVETKTSVELPKTLFLSEIDSSILFRDFVDSILYN